MRFWWRVITLAGVSTLAVTLMGCKEEVGAPLSYSARDQIATQSAGLVSSAQLLGTVEGHLHPDVTPERVREALGAPVHVIDGPILVNNGDWLDGEIWRYDTALPEYTYTSAEPSARADLVGLAEGEVQEQLLLTWALDGTLLEAVLYYVDEEGHIQTNWLVLGSNPGSSSIDNQIAMTHELRIGETVNVQTRAEAYSEPGGERAVVSFYAEKDLDYVLTGLTDRFARLDSDEHRGWVPVWQLTPEAASLRSVTPERRTLLSDAPAYWYPGQSHSASELYRGERMLVIAETENWVSLLPVERGNGGPVSALWVSRSELHDRSEGTLAALNEDERTTYAEAGAALQRSLPAVVTQEAVRHLFGEPQFVEQLHGGQDETIDHSRWRYEHGNFELIVDWNDDGSLSVSKLNRRSSDAPSTVEQPFKWRTKLELAHSFLLGTAGDTLLLFGDDGYISGLHERSNVVALSAADGEKRWQRSFGYEDVQHSQSADKGEILLGGVVTGATTDTEYTHRMEALEASTGRTRWELERQLPLPQSGIDLRHTIAQGVAAVSYTTNEREASDRQQSIIEGYKLKDGKLLWRKELERPGQLVHRLTEGGRLLVHYGGETAADSVVAGLDAVTGKEVWRAEGHAVDMYFYTIQEDQRTPSDTIWTYTESEWRLLDQEKGDVVTILERSPQLRYEILTDGLIMQVRTTDEATVTSLLEADTRSVRWSVPGKLERTVTDETKLYGLLDGELKAYQLSDGKLLWSTPIGLSIQVAKFQDKLVVESQGSILVVDPTQGQILYRMANVVAAGINEAADLWQYHAILNTEEGTELYIGGGNGYFSRVDSLSDE
ncbi:PQQ-binding-like beta-propeller repeat protein [Paenibacillus daejeonensis]|uniref:outer membrane protein assembly factor BamB family protein n=1 Tax=Paenibacillus daejeonensis TaxID=135193 RepID=UPI00039D23C5|nr:PQQ-binding-like beta-propeller repeat protein [Paenibacillus daejeonensis]